MNSEYYCQNCGLTVSGAQREASKFCPTCGSFLRPKVIRTKNSLSPTHRPAQEIEPLTLRREDINVHTLFQEFRTLRNFSCGESIVWDDTEDWLTERRKAYEEFRERFKSSLESPNKTRKVFRDFLYFRNNKSWTTLYRSGTAALQNPARLRELIASLLDESVDIRLRIDNALIGRMHVGGVGRNIVTAVVHVSDAQDRFGVWNSRTEDTLQLLRRAPAITAKPSETYSRINLELNGLKMELGTNLMVLDSFMWYISKRVKVIL